MAQQTWAGHNMNNFCDIDARFIASLHINRRQLPVLRVSYMGSCSPCSAWFGGSSAIVTTRIVAEQRFYYRKYGASQRRSRSLSAASDRG